MANSKLSDIKRFRSGPLHSSETQMVIILVTVGIKMSNGVFFSAKLVRMVVNRSSKNKTENLSLFQARDRERGHFVKRFFETDRCVRRPSR